MSKGPKPILQIFVRFCGAPSPRVRAAADSSSPILAIDIIRGTTRYSSIFMGLRRVVMPRIFMASRIAAYSSLTVGKKSEYHRHRDHDFLWNMHLLHRGNKFTDRCRTHQIISHDKSGEHVRIDPDCGSQDEIQCAREQW